jgi:cytochrome P450
MMLTTSSRNCPIVDLDHHSDAFARDPIAISSELVSCCPIAYTENYGGHYIVTSHALAKQILADTETFSSARFEDGSGGTFIPSFTLPIPGACLLPAESDPPKHSQVRKALATYFNRTGIERLRTHIEGVVASALDEIERKGEFDIVADLGHVVGPSTVMSYLGLPLERRDTYIETITSGYQLKPGDDMSALVEMATEVYGFLQERKEDPRDDVMSEFVSAGRFADVELVSLFMTLLLGGVVTTDSLIANSLWTLDQDRRLRQRLIAHPELVPDAIDEFLRFYTPAPTVARTVMADVQVAGVQMRKGERLMVLLTAGNHDADAFSDPDAIDINRDNSQSVAFGHGPHRCMGARLSKVEVEITLTRLLERIPKYSIDRARARPFPDRSAVNAWLTMPARINL